MNSYFTLALLFILHLHSMMAQPVVIENFEDQTQLTWRIINDGVMGGLSSSRMAILPTEVGQFSGVVSLDNNGGFASTRGVLAANPVHPFNNVKIRVKGDGKKYSFRIRTDSNFDGVSYKQDFVTEMGSWKEIVLPLSAFIPTWRGRLLRDVPAIDPTSIRQLGFLISDKQVGAFNLLIDWIVFE